jgi:predicted ATPase
MHRGASITEPLLERGEELGVLSDLLSGARAGLGGLVLVEGSAGIGKSSILAAGRNEAEGAAMSVLYVRGDELLSDSSFAAVRELFWARVARARNCGFDGAARLAMPVFEGDPTIGSDRDRASAVLHGLYWLTADLAERNPLALLVDDAYWIDAASARFLIYLSRRIEAMPVLLVVALRPGETALNGTLGAELAQMAAARLRLRPLSGAASSELLRGVLGPRADEELCRSCHEATRGNPFYLRGSRKPSWSSGQSHRSVTWRRWRR